MITPSTTAHIFAFFAHDLTHLINQKDNNHCLYKNEALHHRLIHVIRFKPGESFILFDRTNYIRVLLISYRKKDVIEISLQEVNATKEIKPTITALLPLLKREDLHDALYGLTACGATFIQPIITSKSQGSKFFDNHRAQQIIIAAAEQSKNYAFPLLQNPLAFNQLMMDTSATKIFFDPQGYPAWDLISDIRTKSPSHLILMVGPEGDLSMQEKKMLTDMNFIFCSLTNTILRASQAIILGTGMIRSLIK